MAPTVALTGATGFVGSVLLPSLREAGWGVRCLRRPRSGRSALSSGGGVEWIEGSLEDLGSLRGLVDGVDAVVHCAGAVRGASWEDFRQVNVDGLRRLVEATVEQLGPPRFLLVSSLAAREPSLSYYAASKHQGEQVLHSYTGSLNWIGLRPPALYGPGDQELRPLFEWIGSGIAPVLGSGNGRFSLLYVEDLAAAVVQWLERGGGESQVFELHDGRPGGYSWFDVVDTVAQLRGKRVYRFPVPESVLYSLAYLNRYTAQLFGYTPMLTPGKVRELTHPDWVCHNTALDHLLDWRPCVALEEGLQRTLGWGNR